MSETSTSSQEQAEASNQEVVEIEAGPGKPPPVPRSTKGEQLQPVSVAAVPAKTWPPSNISDLMTQKLITLREDEPVGELENWMDRFRFHHLPVIDANSKLVGLITRTDYLHAMISRKDSDPPLTAGAVMRKVVVTAKPEYALTDALRVMLQEKLSCLPVVLDDATLVGIVTQTDFSKLALAFLEL